MAKAGTTAVKKAAAEPKPSGITTKTAGNCDSKGTLTFKVTQLGEPDETAQKLIVTKCCDAGDAKRAFYTHFGVATASKYNVKIENMTAAA